jgi:hypothetical protein
MLTATQEKAAKRTSIKTYLIALITMSPCTRPVDGIFPGTT